MQSLLELMNKQRMQISDEQRDTLIRGRNSSGRIRTVHFRPLTVPRLVQEQSFAQSKLRQEPRLLSSENPSL
ncbi:hypothetical protein C443_00407 [Haloarcula argentinensis DSM 12282]|nr:hypothetical protein C443_00407 [Haloarcula argentinensis DSM 12282]